jgi:hypothetical protein
LIAIRPKVVQKMSANAFYPEIFFAESVVGARESEAQWYSINPLHNDIPSLANRQSKAKKRFRQRKKNGSQNHGDQGGLTKRANTQKELKRAKQQRDGDNWILKKKSWLCHHHRVKSQH